MNTSRENAEVQPQVSKPTLRKNWYLPIGLIVIIIAAFSIYYLAYMPTEVVALGIKYNRGDKMTYEIDVTMTMTGQELSYNMTQKIEVLDKENGIYTLRTTSILMNQTYSITMRISELGHMVEVLDVPPEFQQFISSFSFMPGNGLYFPSDETKVGDSWQIPIDTQTEVFNITGTINNKLASIQSINVPAGTYQVFKLEITSSEVTIEFEPLSELDMTEPIEIDVMMEGYIYFEQETCLVVQAFTEQTTTTSMMGQTISMTMTLDMRLTEHTK